MKRLMILMLSLLLSAGLYAREEGFHTGSGDNASSDSHHDDQGSSGGGHEGESHESRSNSPRTQSRTQTKTQSRTERSSQPGVRSNGPSRNRSQQSRRTNNRSSASTNSQRRQGAQSMQVRSGSAASARSSHSRAFTPAKAQARLHSLGITHAPERVFSKRSQILVSSRAQSVIRMPHTGLGGHAITSVAIGIHGWNNNVVRTQMGLIGGAHMSAFNQLNLTETRRNHYYWHHDGGYDYCHYYDPWGYHWYGWYVGSSYFWTRYYSDRWWFYDTSFDRWCYWNDGFWWWQNPANMNAVYVYDNGQYVPSNDEAQTAAPDDAAPAEPASNGPSVYRSGDDTRMVKIMGDSQDAFLYDTAIPPSFSPLYLASKVDNVKFSDTSNGKPLQIMVTLSDGTFDIFDAQGESMNFSDAKPDNEGAASAAPDDGDTAPAPPEK